MAPGPESPAVPIEKPKRSLLRRVSRLVVIAVLTYAGVCVLVDFFQSRLIYFPSRGYPYTPKDVGLPFESVSLQTADGVRLSAWYVPSANAKRSVIFCHGNAGNISDRLVQAKLLVGLGHNVFLFDYRGYGDSEGHPTEQGTYLDAEAAWSFLTRTKAQPPETVVLFGESLGGAVAIELASRHSPGALIVESTFTSFVDIAKLHYPLLPVGFLLRYRYDSLSKVPTLACPKLFIHSTDDQLVPIANARRLFAAAAPPKEFLETPGEHNTGGFTYSPEFTSQVGTFLTAALVRQ